MRGTNSVCFFLVVALQLACSAVALNSSVAVAQQFSSQVPEGLLRIRVLSYNIHHAEGTDGVLDVERIAAVICSVNPDLVSLQEVDRRCSRSDNADQPAELAELTGFTSVFVKNIDLQGGEYGNAVLSRWPVIEHRNHALPNHRDGEQRGALAVSVRPPGFDSELTLIATHFDHRPDDSERIASAQMLNDVFGADEIRPVILAGDLNARPDSAVLAKLLPTWGNASRQVMLTSPADKPRSQIDYVLMRPARRWKVIECGVLDEAVASDHRAIFSVIELQK